MQLPPMLQGDSLKRLIQGAVGGAILAMVVGFGWGGWTLGSTAEKNAQQRVNTALVAALTPVCVEHYNEHATADQRTEFAKTSKWSRDSFIRTTAFATPAGAKEPNRDVAEACAQKLSEALDKLGPSASK